MRIFSAEFSLAFGQVKIAGQKCFRQSVLTAVFRRVRHGYSKQEDTKCGRTLVVTAVLYSLVPDVETESFPFSGTCYNERQKQERTI